MSHGFVLMSFERWLDTKSIYDLIVAFCAIFGLLGALGESSKNTELKREIEELKKKIR